MKRNWELDELIEHFTLMPQEMRLIGNKTGENRLGFAVMLKFFQNEARFPHHKNEVPKVVVEYIAKQIDCVAEIFIHYKYEWTNRNFTYHRSQIREFFGFREYSTKESEFLSAWLFDNIIIHDQDHEHVKEAAYGKLRELQIEPPTPDRLERLVRAAIHEYEEKLFQSIFKGIPNASLLKIDELIESVTAISDLDEEDSNSDSLSFQDLKSDPGRVGLESAMKEVAKLRLIRNLELPSNLFQNVPPKVLRKYRQRVASEDIRELRRHPDPIRYSLLGIFFYLRGMEITDNLVELLIQIIHRIGVKAERKVDREILNELKRVSGKNTILFNMAETALNNPDGVIRHVIYPVVGEETLKDLVKEFKHTGPAYREKVHNVIRASYSSHYRRMVPELLAILDFRSNNEVHRTVIHALNLIKKYSTTGHSFFPTHGLYLSPA